VVVADAGRRQDAAGAGRQRDYWWARNRAVDPVAGAAGDQEDGRWPE